MDEMTKKAMEQVKKAKKEPETSRDTKKTEQVDTPVEKKSELGSNKIVLGSSKVVTIRPWTGKTKKRFRKIFEYVQGPEDINFDEVMNALLYDHIEEDVYLNEGEQQMLLAALKTISIDSEVIDEPECPSCSAKNRIKTDLSKILSYKENQFPHEYNNDITFIDIKNIEALKEVLKRLIDEDYDGVTSATDIEFAMHLDIQKDGKTLKLEEVIDYLDDLPLSDLDDLISKYKEVAPKCDFQLDKLCSNCGTEQTFDLDITTGIFENLLK